MIGKIYRILQFLIPATMVSLVLTISAQAQNYEQVRAELQQKQAATSAEIQRLKKQILSYQDQITQTDKKFTTLNKEYENLNKEIALRNALINKLNKERDEIENEIDVTRESYNQKQAELNKLIANYKKTLVYLYEHGRVSELALILTSKSFNQMLVRSYYLRKFEQYRTNQEKEIKQAQNDLKQKESELNDARSRNKKVLDETKSEKEKLKSRTTRQKHVIAALRRDRRNLRGMLSNVRKQVNDLNKTLSRLIAESERVRKKEEERIMRLEAVRQKRLAEAEKIKDAAKRKAEIAKYSKPIVEPKETMSDNELKVIQKEFGEDKGKLPWPVSHGVITDHFGTKVNPVYGTRITNYGIDIATSPKAPVHAVFNGYVFAVQPLTGFGNLVFVNHGRYKTVYGNLSQVLVHTGMIVHQGDVVGLSGDKNSAKGDAVFFLIRDGNKNVNPENWLKKK